MSSGTQGILVPDSTIFAENLGRVGFDVAFEASVYGFRMSACSVNIIWFLRDAETKLIFGR